MDPVERFASTVRTLRLAQGLTQMQAADRAGLALAYWGRIERGERDPGVRSITRVARGLGVQPSDLLAGIPPADDQTPRMKKPSRK